MSLAEATSSNPDMFDIVTFTLIFILLGILVHISNKEMKKSLEQSRVTERVLKQRLNESTKALRESEIARMNELAKAAEFGRLAQGLFHDLMTPLTSMILHTEKIQKATEASNLMTRYIHDIRTTLSHEKSERECLLQEELEGIVRLLTYKTRTAGIQIEVQTDNTPTWYGNPIKIRQICSNLISNAIDAFDAKTLTRNSQKKIGVSLSRSTTEITLEVCDNGSGIPPAHMKKIFEPFFTTKPFDRGTGIGLTTVKSIVEKDLKGKIAIESEEGKGTCVRVIFPQRINPAASPPLPQTPPLPV